MFAIVKSSEGWTVRDDEFGVVIGSYTRLLDAQARVAEIARNTAIVESFVHPASFDVPELCDCGHYREACDDCPAFDQIPASFARLSEQEVLDRGLTDVSF